MQWLLFSYYSFYLIYTSIRRATHYSTSANFENNQQINYINWNQSEKGMEMEMKETKKQQKNENQTRQNNGY